MKTDSIFYRLFQVAPNTLFELIGDNNPRGTTYGFGSQEVKQTAFTIDGILIPPIYATNLPIFFVETQAYKDKKGENIYYRFFGEIYLYLKDYQPSNDWRAVLIFTKKSFDPRIPKQYSEFENNPRLQRIYLDKLPLEYGDRSLGLGVMQLLGMKNQTAPERGRVLLDRVQQELTDVQTQNAYVELIETLFVYKFPKFSREEIETMLGLGELKHTRVYQEAMQEQGAAMVLQQLSHRFGAISAEKQAQIQQLSAAQLTALAIALLEFSSLQDFDLWLQTQTQGSSN